MRYHRLMLEGSQSKLPAIRAEDGIALFLDLDGTLVDFASHPDDVVLLERTRNSLQRLHERLGGAVAIITGRDIETVDRITAPVHLPIAGVHGLMRRDANGQVHHMAVDDEALERIRAQLDVWSKDHPGVLVERKPGAVALHYRKRPDLEDACAHLMDEMGGGLEGFLLLRGKSVIELRGGGTDKGQAIRAFISEEPFAGRKPVFAGDDVTDEDGFEAVNAKDGITIKVGEGKSVARYRAETVEAFTEWLAATAERLSGKAR